LYTSTEVHYDTICDTLKALPADELSRES